jgi:2-amino-4-hydroxy-6-hydroxymethyldihydropteridine diphosphokinase
LSASADPEPLHQVYLSIGSNIDPEMNVPRAIKLLREHWRDLVISTAYETPAVGSPGPDFINLAVGLNTPLDAASLKQQVLAPIENRLGRVRSADKNAPRTIDLDILVFDDTVIDPQLWVRTHLAVPLAELLPDLENPQTRTRLREIAGTLRRSSPIRPRPEFS